MSEVVTNVELTTGEMKYLIDSMWGTSRHDSQAYAIRHKINEVALEACLLYTSPSPRDRQKSRMPSSA